MTELGYLTLSVLVYEGDKVISIQPFNVLILDDYMGGASSFIELIQELERLIDNMKLDLNNAVKLTDKGIPNGVASLDESGKIPLAQMPQEFQGFLDHINHTVFEHRVHGLGLDEDEQLMYQDNNGDWQYIGFSPTGVGGGATQTVSASISVANSVATVIYSGVPTVVQSKWSTGDNSISYFTLNGSSFTGNTFPISSTGIHTLYYKDSNGLEYVKTFNVTMDMIARPNVTINVDDGYVTVNVPPNVSTSIKKWAKGNQTVSYFAYNGTTFTGNTFQVTEVGTYTVYIKTVTGLEYVYTFEVTESMLQEGSKIDKLPYGKIIKFDNEDWVLLEPNTGYIARLKPLNNLQAYDTKRELSGNNFIFGNTYNPTSNTNIGYYLNTTYYNSISSKYRNMIVNSKFSKVAISESNSNSTISALKSVEMSSTVNANIGMLSISDWKKHSRYYNTTGVLSYPNLDIWLLNGVAPSGSNAWWIINGMNQSIRQIIGVGTSAAAYTIPTLYLNTSLRIKPDGEII